MLRPNSSRASQLIILGDLVLSGLCYAVHDAAKLVPRSTITVNVDTATSTVTVPGAQPTTLVASSSILLTDTSEIVSYIQTAIPSEVRSQSSYACFVNSQYDYYSTPSWYTSLPPEVQSYYSSVNQDNTAACTSPGPSSTATSTQAQQSSTGGGLSTGAKVGIALGAVGAVAALLSALWTILKGNPCGHSPAKSAPAAAPQTPSKPMMQSPSPAHQGPVSPPPGYQSPTPMSQPNTPMWNGQAGSQAPPLWNGSAGSQVPSAWNGSAGSQAPTWNGSAGNQPQPAWNGSVGNQAPPTWNGSAGSEAPWNGAAGSQTSPTWNGTAGTDAASSAGNQAGSDWNGVAGSDAPTGQGPPFNGQAGSDAIGQTGPTWNGAAGGDGNWSGAAGGGSIPPAPGGAGQIPFVPIVAAAAYRRDRDRKELQQRTSSYAGSNSNQSGYASPVLVGSLPRRDSLNELPGPGVSSHSPWAGYSNESVRAEMPVDASPFYHEAHTDYPPIMAQTQQRTASSHSIPRRPVGSGSSSRALSDHGAGSPQPSYVGPASRRDSWSTPGRVSMVNSASARYPSGSPQESGSNSIYESGSRTIHEADEAYFRRHQAT